VKLIPGVWENVLWIKKTIWISPFRKLLPWFNVISTVILTSIMLPLPSDHEEIGKKL
jgi:hypothetical protein